MKYLISCLLFLVVLPAWSGSDPVQACRDQHPEEAEAHIACLESAVTELLGKHANQPGSGQGIASKEPPENENPTGLGAEQLRAAPTPEEAAIDSEQVRIISARYNAEGIGTFRMENGQVWRETMAAPKRWRLAANSEYEARIERGTLGGYRLYVDGIRGMLTVRRIQ